LILGGLFAFLKPKNKAALFQDIFKTLL